jgi:glycosyltransferase involved in cell wall biosynthesis
MSAERPVIVIGDHPALHRGFSTVGRHIARYLHGTGRWCVQFLARYPPPANAPAEPYEVFEGAEEHEGDGTWRLTGMLRGLLADADDASAVVLVLSIGTPLDQCLVLGSVGEAGVRSRVRLVAYAPVNVAPIAPGTADVLRRFDVVVPFTNHARRALDQACGAAGPTVSPPIPHGVDIGAFRPPLPEARRRTRMDLFGLEDDDLLVGYFGRNSGHKHPDMTVAVFAAFARGLYVTCRACARVTVADVDPLEGLATGPARCGVCGSDQLVTGARRDRARLYLHTELLDAKTRALSGGWDLARLARLYGISHQVVFSDALQIGEGVPEHELAWRMGACDIHFLPYEGGGWELTVLETAACGVANVVTDTSAPPEYAAPFSELVPTRLRLLDGAGLRGLIDPGSAVQALVRLADDPRHRQSLADHGLRSAARYAWAHIGPQWDQLLTAMVEGGKT